MQATMKTGTETGVGTGMEAEMEIRMTSGTTKHLNQGLKTRLLRCIV